MVQKKLGMTRPVFDKVIQSNDMFEWSVGAALNAASKHDNEVIEEADVNDECTTIFASQIELDDARNDLEAGFFNQSVVPDNFKGDADLKDTNEETQETEESQ